MDWGRIQRDMKFQTSSILSKTSNTLNDRHYTDREFGSHPSSRERDIESQPYSHSHILIAETKSNEIQIIQDIISKQNDKINKLESLIESRCPKNSPQEFLQQRVEQIEVDIQSFTRHFATISRESSELLVHSKNVSGRIQWLEETLRSSTQECVTKSTFSHFLDTCTEQLKAVHASTEASRSNSTTAMSFIQALLSAFSQLQGQRGSRVLGLEFLAALSSPLSGYDKPSNRQPY
jgi:hypothetical protein